jgi:hypothetical protein
MLQCMTHTATSANLDCSHTALSVAQRHYNMCVRYIQLLQVCITVCTRACVMQQRMRLRKH